MGPKLLTYPLGEGAVAFSTLRDAGDAGGAYAGFNANPFCGDDAVRVQRHQERLCSFLSIDNNHLIIPHQTHHDRVVRIDEAFFTLPPDERGGRLEGVDAVMTHLPGVCVSVSTADCIPVLLYDASRRAVAAVHAGWRGTVAHIVASAVSAMQAAYGTRPQELQAVIGPGISLDAFEVGDEVYERFREACFPVERLACRYPARDGLPGAMKWHLDLWEANRWELMEKGVPSRRIHVAGICTYACHDRFFSARRLGIRSGRILNGILLQP